MELGAKIAYIKETKYFPQIGTFTMFEMPTGNYDKGLGVGKVWYKLPSGCRRMRAIGCSMAVPAKMVPQTGFRNFPYGGFLVKREISERLELGGEVFSQARGDCAAAADASVDDDRCRRLLPLQAQSQTSSFCFAMATRSPGKPRTTPMSGCTGRGGRMRKAGRQGRAGQEGSAE